MNIVDSDLWLEGFSLRFYQPMVRLASGKDPHYLAGAGTVELARRYRKQQRTLLREYLRGLSKDFQTLHAIASARENSERSTELCDGQWSFIFLVLWIEIRLAIQALFPQAIEMGTLLESVDELARATRELARPALRSYVASRG